jgi:hypothetical protein
MKARPRRQQFRPEDLIAVSPVGEDYVWRSFFETLIEGLHARGLSREEIDAVIRAAIAAAPNNPLNPRSPGREALLADLKASSAARPPATGQRKK